MFEVGSRLTLSELQRVADGELKASLGADARERVAANRAYVERLVEAGETVYGVTTGFGKLSDVAIPPERLAELQAGGFASNGFDELSPAVLYAILRLRTDVFVVEQRCAYPELDGRDLEHGTEHWWIEADDHILSCLRVLREQDRAGGGHRAAAENGDFAAHEGAFK